MTDSDEEELSEKQFKICLIGDSQGAKYLVFFSSRSLKTREKYISFAKLVLLSLYIFWGMCVYFSIFEW